MTASNTQSSADKAVQQAKDKKIHIIINSHMDPVWLWNRSIGRRAWTNTASSVLKMMRRHDEIRFTCSSSAMYRWIEETEPGMFAEIRSLVREGRWELIGGWEVQSDAITASAESIRLQGIFGRRYFQDKFGVDVHIGYCVDSFGHSSGLPKLLRETGFDAYLFMRGGVSLPPLFRWKAPDGSAVTGIHIPSYGQMPKLTPEQLEAELTACLDTNPDGGLFFFGVGDHGGIFSERLLGWLEDFMKDFRFKFSTVESYLAEHCSDPMPTVTGAIDGVFRGCYSVNHAVKRKIAETGRLLMQAKALGVPERELERPIREWLFCHFHDSLPGTCIREAYERDVFPALDGAAADAIEATDKAIAKMASAADTSFMPEGGIFAVNPYPNSNRFPVSFPAFTDPNVLGSDFDSLTGPDGNVIPLQVLPSDSSFGPCGMGWGKLTAMLDLAAGESRGYAFSRTGKKFPNVGFGRSKALLQEISFAVYYDDYRTWGFDLVSFSGHCDVLRPEKTEFTIDGPAVSIAKAVYRYRGSSIVLRIYDFAGLASLKIEIETEWHEHRTALKLVRNTGLRAQKLICGSMETVDIHQLSGSWASGHWVDGVFRPLDIITEEFPMIGFCAVSDGKRFSGLYSEDLHGVDAEGPAVRPTLLRCVPFADHKPFKANDDAGFIDEGRSTFTLWTLDECSDDPQSLLSRAAVLRQMPACCEVSPHEAGEFAAKV